MKQVYQQPHVKFVILQDEVVRTSGLDVTKKGDADVTAWPEIWV